MPANSTLKVSGGDYSSMFTWEATEQGNFDATEPYTLAISDGDYGGLNGSLEESVSISGWTTPTSTNNVSIFPATAADGHQGVVGDGFTLRGPGPSVNVMTVSIQNVIVRGFSVDVPAGGFSGIQVTQGNGTVDSIIFSTASAEPAVLSGSFPFNVLNCLFLAASISRESIVANFSNTLQNNTVIGGIDGIRITDGSSNITQNNVCFGQSDEGFSVVTSTTAESNNASEDATAPGANPQTGIVITDGVDFVSPSTNDYSPASGGKLAGNGTTPPILTLDIAGNTRNDPDDIGAYAVAAAGGVTVTGTPQAQAATTAGQVNAFAVVGVQGTPQAQDAITAGNVNVIGFVATVTITLVDNLSVPAANLTGLKWAFFDEVTPDLLLAPVDQANTGATDPSGIFSVSLPGSSLTLGQTGYLIVSDTDGTEGQAPAQKAFAGPAVVS